MDLEIFTICDYAQEMAGKLVIVGVFDTINTMKLPANHPTMAIAARMRFEPAESGQHSFRVSMLDPERENVIPPLNGDVNVQIPSGADSGSANLVLGLAGVQFKFFGKHVITLALDDEEIKTVPFYIKQQR